MFFIPLMSFFSRLCGAKWSPKWWPAEWVWAGIIAFIAASTLSQFAIYLLWGYIAMQLGHGRFYAMKGVNLDDPNVETIEPYIQKIYKGDITKPIYSWLCMGTKGFLIALPIGLWAAFSNAILWPISYWVGWKINGNSPEWIAGASVGILLCLNAYLTI